MEQNIVGTDYQVIQERTPDVIRTEIKTIEAQVYKTTLDGVIQIGRRLQELKEMIGHGNWMDWCKENLGYTDRQARRYMEISAEYGKENSAFSNWTTSSNLSISKAYSLLALPESELEDFTQEHDIESSTVKELEAQIREWKDRMNQTQAELDVTKAENEELQMRAKEDDGRRMELVEKIEELEKQETNPEELNQLREKLDEKEEDIKKVKENLEKEKSTRQEAIDTAIEEAKEKMRKEVEEAQAEKMKAAEKEAVNRIRESEEHRRAAENQVMQLKKRLAQSDKEELIRFKLKTDQLQMDFKDLRETIQQMEKSDSDQAEKLRYALMTVMENMASSLDLKGSAS